MVETAGINSRHAKRVAFADFWPGFDPHDNILSAVLTERLGMSVVDDQDQADFLIYSVFGDKHQNFKGIRVFYTGESVKPRWDECDYAISFMREDIPYPECHLRMPCWMNNGPVRRTGKVEQYSKDRKSLLSRHTRFCNFIYSNGNAPERIHFLRLLSRYKHVDCGGMVMNNMGSCVRDKIAFCSSCKFTIAFENYPAAGYVTEKLFDSLAALSLPIYWGAPDAGMEANPSRFVDAADFSTPEALAEYVIRLDQDEDLYLSYMDGPLFVPGQPDIGEYVNRLTEFFSMISCGGNICRTGRPRTAACRLHHGYPVMSRHDDGKQWTGKAELLLPQSIEETPFPVFCPEGKDTASQFIRKLAIIPAKKHSERCPHKNRRLLNGRPLFLYSVSYALQEGFVPVVSTDSEEVMEHCRREGIQCFRETVDDRRMENCVRQVLARFSCDMFAVLQPTSPFRRRGLLRQMAEDMEKGIIQSAYTARKTKMIGHLEGHFHLAHREQDAKKFFYFFDGNINVVTRKKFLESGTMFDDGSCPYPNDFPCCLQIDTEEEWKVLSRLGEFKDCQCFLASEGHKKRICIVSNKRDLKRNYSSFVDSCDKVIRISKMDNLNSGLAGKRTDIVLVSCFPGYLAFSPKERHMEILRGVPEIYFNNEELGYSNEFACREGLENWKFMPGEVHRSTGNFTTLSKALCLADYLFPEAQLYYLGDTDMNLRAAGSSKHHAPTENAYMQSLIDSGRVIPILEDAAGEFHYSIPALPVSSQDNGSSPDMVPLDTILISHPQWTDQFQMTEKRGRRLHRNDHATILQHDESKLVLKWDNWGTEEFLKMEEGKYRYLDYHYSSTINEVNKYAVELLINPYDGNNSVFRHSSRPFIGMRYHQWEGLLLLERMYRDIEKGVRKMPRLQSVLLMGICKDAFAALILAQRLKKDFPHLHIGVWGCPWTVDFSGKSPVYRGIKVSPSHEQIREKRPFNNLLERYGDPLKLLRQPESSGLCLFAFYSTSQHWTLDEEATNRLAPYLLKTYAHPAGSKEHYTVVHGKIVHLVKEKPALVQSWIEEMFRMMKTESENHEVGRNLRISA